MDRLACLELPALPLQLLLRAHEAWRGEPAAVIERDAPHALVLSVNARARALGVLPGQRYAAALGTCARLRAGALEPGELERGVAELVRALQRFSPHVEACAEEPGVFWLGARGLERLFGAPARWAGEVLAHARAAGFHGRIAVGFRHFGAYAAVKARARAALVVLDDPAHEARVAAGVALQYLPIEAEARDALAKLGIATLGGLAELPAGGVLRRFGPAVHRLHRMAAGALDDALAPAEEHVPLAAREDLDLPDESLESILARAEALALPLCEALARRGAAASAIVLSLGLDDGGALEERVVPAAPTCDVAWLVRLLRMRLEGRSLARGASSVEVILERALAPAEQATLFRAAKSRPKRAAAKAFSALRAAFGEQAVVRARTATAHLPERSFTWEPCEGELPEAAPPPRGAAASPAPGERALVRTLFEKPLALPPRGRHEPDGWLLRGVAHGSVTKLSGPFRLSGGWWGSEVRREYYFAELTGGEVCWIYYDVARRRWFLQGALA